MSPLRGLGRLKRSLGSGRTQGSPACAKATAGRRPGLLAYFAPTGLSISWLGVPGLYLHGVFMPPLRGLHYYCGSACGSVSPLG